MRFLLSDILGNEIYVEKILYYEIKKSIATPCDGIEFAFLTDKPLSEQSTIQVFKNDELVFNGYVDYQSQQIVSTKSKIVIKGRSSACILVDSECAPISYHTPSVDDLFEKYAKPYGFVSELPQMVCDYNFSVVKGSSRWTVLSNFVKNLGEEGFYVTPNNHLVPNALIGEKWVISNENDYAKHIDKSENPPLCHFSSAVLTFKRSSPISKVIYKIETGDEYKYSGVCQEVTDKGINRERYLNLANIPGWKRTGAVHSVIENSLTNYFSLVVTIGGSKNFNLNDRAHFVDKTIGSFMDLRIKEINYSSDSKGEQTVLCLVTGEKVKEDIYVD